MFDDEVFETPYGDISIDLSNLKLEIESLDTNSLVQESKLIIEGIICEQVDIIKSIVFKHECGEELLQGEIDKLRFIYLTFYSRYGYYIDHALEDLFDENDV